MNTIRLPPEVAHILTRLAEAGHTAVVVGGCVRDSLRGTEPDDWDIATDALPERVAALFSDLPVIPTGMAHGTVTVVLDSRPYEVTAFRTDGSYSDGRHPDFVRLGVSLEQDLSRRDFTVNAMAWHPTKGLIDPFGGQRDLHEKIIRCVGTPQARFAEDALRLLRAVRFSATLGFDVEQDTAQAVDSLSSTITRVAPERARVELEKLLCGAAVASALARFHRLLFALIPALEPLFGFEQRTPHHHLDVWQHTVATVQCIRPDPVLRMVMLLHDIGKPACATVDDSGRGHFHGHPKVSAQMADHILRTLRYDNPTRSAIVRLIEVHDQRTPPEEVAVRRALANLGPEAFELLLEIQRADTRGQHPATQEEKLARLDTVDAIARLILQRGDCIALRDLRIDGSDLLALGFPKSQALGHALRSLLASVVDGSLPNQRDALMAAAVELKQATANGLPADSG